MTDTALQEVEEKHAGGRPPEITTKDAEDFLAAISDGLTQEQAADIVGFNEKSMAKWVKRHPELGVKVSRARADCVRARIKAQTKIGDVSDIKGLNAAVKANACLLAAYDDRFRKQRDGDGPGGGGTNITVITAIQPQSVAGFFAAGGKAQPQAIKILVEKYGQGILGEITEETALKVADESMSENNQGAPIDTAPELDSPLDDGSTSDNVHSVTLSEDGARASKSSDKNEIGTQSEDRGGQRPGDARTHTPNHPPTLSDNSEGPLDPVPAPCDVEPTVIPPESVILDSPVRPEEAPDGTE